MLQIPARPFPYTLRPGLAALVIIDMQRDFIEPGGFGASLGNDVSRLQAAIEPTRRLLEAWRKRRWPVLHTRESHAPDLSDCPPAKRERTRTGQAHRPRTNYHGICFKNFHAPDLPSNPDNCHRADLTWVNSFWLSVGHHGGVRNPPPWSYAPTRFTR